MSADKVKKKQKVRGISLNLLFTTGLSIIFLLSVASLVVIASNSIDSLGQFAQQVSEKSLKSGASFLFLEKNRKKAEQYSRIFNEASDLASLLSVQLTLGWENFPYYIFPDNFHLKYTKNLEDSPDAPMAGVLSNKLRFCYWGDKKVLPMELQKKIYYFGHNFELIKYINDKNKYYLSCWITFSNEKYFLLYSNSDDDIMKDLPDRKTLNNFFQPKTIPKNGNWTDVYRDISGKFIVSTYKDILGASGRTVGLVGVDVDVDKLLKSILVDEITNSEKIKASNASFSFVFSRNNGRLIAFPHDYYKLFDLPEQDFNDYEYRQELNVKITDSKNDSIKELLKHTNENSNGILEIELNDENYLLVFSRVIDNNWVLCYLYPENLLFTSVNKTRLTMKSNARDLAVLFIVIAILFLVLSAFLVTRFFNRSVLKPVITLQEGVQKLGDGCFDSKLEERGILEVKGLTRSFNRLKFDLKNYMKKLEDEVSQRRSLETEIEIAQQIQYSSMQHVSAIFQRDEFDIYAELYPAKIIAGDCYDFFYLKKNKIALLVGDVSGRGEISAAFYLAALKSTIRDVCLQKSEDPAEALVKINRILCEEFKVEMYVSLFLIYYDIDLGMLQYGNAGHYTALAVTKNGEYERIGSFGNTVLGSSMDAVYKSEKKELGLEETVFLYTDGVIKAGSENGSYYGEDKLISFIVDNRQHTSKEICDLLYQDIAKFENNNSKDDKTMLSFKRRK